jgi:hypothetical protein
MKNKIPSQKNIAPGKNHKKWSVSRIKKYLGCLLLLSMLEANMGNAQMKELPDSIRKLSKGPAKTEIVKPSDHQKLITMNADSLDIDTIRNEILIEINTERTKK